MGQRTALIAGITGQYGAYLAEFLLNKNVVHDIRRRTSLFNTHRIDHLYMDAHEQNARLFLHYGDMTDTSSLVHIIQETVGQQRSVREFADLAAQNLDMKIRWVGDGLEEKGFDPAGNCVVAVDPRNFRPTEVETLLGDASKAREELGLSP